MTNKPDGILNFFIGLFALIYAQIAASELIRIIACCFFASYCLAYQVKSKRLLSKIKFVFVFGSIGSIMTGLTCAIITKVFFFDASNWPGAIGMVGTWFITYFRSDIPVWIKTIIEKIISRK